MEIFWTVVTTAFVVGVLSLVAFAIARVFGGAHWHRPQH
jgi:hypothetical protein